jgi:hypothetical protein
MHIPRYWVKGAHTAQSSSGKPVSFTCWHWSDASLDDARRKADERARSIALKLAAQQPLDRYGYGERPMREEVVQAVKSPGGSEVALVTRNAYGALVLNAEKAMFIDIDFDKKESGGGLASAFKGLFGKPAPGPEESHRQRVVEWAQKHPDLGLRIYRTFGGLRCLVTNATFDPQGGESRQILQELRSDPL